MGAPWEGDRLSFDLDLEIGKRVERSWIDRMKVAFRQTYQTFGEDSRYDIAVPELSVTIEVKYDPKSRETGNVVVEYYHNQPSGILTSTATHWLFDLGEEELWFDRRSLIGCILMSGEKPVQIHGPGDRHAKAVFLIPVETLRQFANRPPSFAASSPPTRE